MKKLTAFILGLALLVVCLSACEIAPKTEKPDVSLLEFPGLKWGMTPEEAKAALNITDDMITEEKTYFVILGVNIPIKEANWEESKTSTLAFITQQGEIEMREDNTYLEYINNHYLDKSLNNTISNLRYRFSEENKNILYVEYNLNGTDDDGWVSEIWLRVIPLGAK